MLLNSTFPLMVMSVPLIIVLVAEKLEFEPSLMDTAKVSVAFPPVSHSLTSAASWVARCCL